MTLSVATAYGQRVEFSRKHGFYERQFGLSLSVVDTDQPESYKICYTTDGTEPGPQSKIWTRAQVIKDNTILRAAAVDAEGKVYEVATATYLFADKVMQQPANPAGYPSTWGDYCELWGTAVADYEMDPEMTRDPQLSGSIKEGLTAIPTLSIVTNPDYFFSHENSEDTGGI